MANTLIIATCCLRYQKPYSLVVSEQDEKNFIFHATHNLRYQNLNIISPEQDDKILIVVQPY